MPCNAKEKFWVNWKNQISSVQRNHNDLFTKFSQLEKRYNELHSYTRYLEDYCLELDVNSRKSHVILTRDQEEDSESTNENIFSSHIQQGSWPVIFHLIWLHHRSIPRYLLGCWSTLKCEEIKGRKMAWTQSFRQDIGQLQIWGPSVSTSSTSTSLDPESLSECTVCTTGKQSPNQPC